jgi:hypothetical protein
MAMNIAVKISKKLYRVTPDALDFLVQCKGAIVTPDMLDLVWISDDSTFDTSDDTVSII